MDMKKVKQRVIAKLWPKEKNKVGGRKDQNLAKI